MKFKLLDLFCGAGGASMGYYRAGFEVVGIDIKPQPHYPFKFIQADAMIFPLDGYDIFHASCPCQRYSMMMHIAKSTNKHPDLIDPIRNRFLATRKPFILENVVGAPLKNPILLCGSSFGLNIIRHRIFEINPPIFNLFPPCNHDGVYDPWHGEGGIKQKEKLAQAMGINWFMSRPEVREAIPPAYTEWIGKILIRIFEG